MTRSPDRLARLLREPLVHFLFLGLVVFAVWSATNTEPAEARTIVLDGARKEEIIAEFRRSRGRDPSPEETAQLVDGWIAQEILFREGLALGLDRDDPVVRTQVVGKMATFYRSLAEVTAPDDATLRAYLERHQDRYSTPERWDFVHVYLASRPGRDEAALDQLIEQLKAGADPHRLGDRFEAGRRFRQRNRDAVTELFDADFAAALARETTALARETAALEREGDGTISSGWFGVRSRHGWHAVRILRHHPAQSARFEAIRAELEAHYRRDQELAHAREAVEDLREAYRVVERSP